MPESACIFKAPKKHPPFGVVPNERTDNEMPHKMAKKESAECGETPEHRFPQGWTIFSDHCNNKSEMAKTSCPE